MNDPSRPVAQTPLGAVRGERVGAVSRFLGVPYARLVRRFLPAGPAERWEGVREATRFGPACIQPVSTLSSVYTSTEPLPTHWLDSRTSTT